MIQLWLIVVILQSALLHAEIKLPLKRGEGMVGYNMEVEFGTPPQVLSMEVDTGFSFAVVPSVTFPFCGKGFVFPCFDPANSTTLHVITCSEMPTYMCANCTGASGDEECIPNADYLLFDDGGQWRWRSDIVNIGGSSARVTFLLWESSPNPSDQGFGGDLGMMWPYLNSSPQPIPASTSILASFSESVENATLSFCLNNTGGSVMLGGGPLPYSHQFQYLDSFPSDSGVYNFSLVDVQVDGVSLLRTSDNEQTAYWTGPDSGTWGVRIPQFVYDNFYQLLLENYCQQGIPLVGVCDNLIYSENETLFDNYCYPLTPEDMTLFPTVQIILSPIEEEMNNITLHWTPVNYFSNFHILTALGYQMCGKETYFGLSWMAGEFAWDGGVILGSTFLQQFVTVIDASGPSVDIGWGLSEGCPT